MKIVPNQRFLDGHNEYLPDQEYEVSLENGVYFCRNGWADSPEVTAEEQPPVADLEIQNLKVDIKDSNG